MVGFKVSPQCIILPRRSHLKIRALRCPSTNRHSDDAFLNFLLEALIEPSGKIKRIFRSLIYADLCQNKIRCAEFQSSL